MLSRCDKLVMLHNVCITLPIRFLRSGDRRNRRLTGSMTVLTVLTVRVFASEQKYRTVRLTVETVGGDRRRPYALTVSGRSYGFYGQLLRLIKAGLDRGGFISSSAFEGSTSLRCQQRRNSRGSPSFGVTVRIDRTGLTVETVGSVNTNINVQKYSVQNRIHL